jgi:hypothetical protein
MILGYAPVARGFPYDSLGKYLAETLFLVCRQVARCRSIASARSGRGHSRSLLHNPTHDFSAFMIPHIIGACAGILFSRQTVHSFRGNIDRDRRIVGRSDPG